MSHSHESRRCARSQSNRLRVAIFSTVSQASRRRVVEASSEMQHCAGRDRVVVTCRVYLPYHIVSLAATYWAITTPLESVFRGNSAYAYFPTFLLNCRSSGPSTFPSQERVPEPTKLVVYMEGWRSGGYGHCLREVLSGVLAYNMSNLLRCAAMTACKPNTTSLRCRLRVETESAGFRCSAS